MLSQPQLIQGALSPGDVVYTPDWCARDMVEWFKPSGRVLEPCKGDGAIYKYLPDGSEWCEIELGRDFFAYSKQVDWIVSNPPFSMFDEFMLHSYGISQNIVYLITLKNTMNAHGRVEMFRRGGWMKHIRFYGTGGGLGWAMGNEIGAIHFVRGYTGPTSWSWYK